MVLRQSAYKTYVQNQRTQRRLEREEERRGDRSSGSGSDGSSDGGRSDEEAPSESYDISRPAASDRRGLQRTRRLDCSHLRRPTTLLRGPATSRPTPQPHPKRSSLPMHHAQRRATRRTHAELPCRRRNRSSQQRQFHRLRSHHSRLPRRCHQDPSCIHPPRTHHHHHPRRRSMHLRPSRQVPSPPPHHRTRPLLLQDSSLHHNLVHLLPRLTQLHLALHPTSSR